MTLSAPQWSRLVRFIAAEDDQEHFGQPIDEQADVGQLEAKGRSVKVYEIVGDTVPFDGSVKKEVTLTVKKLLSPIRRDQAGGSIRLLGANFHKHVQEANIPFPKEPVVMISPRTALTGPGEIPIPSFVHKSGKPLDYETELAVVIGKEAKDVPEDKALDYVLGYTGSNDVTARYHQGSQSQWNFAKGFDNFCPIGPVLVSANTLLNPSDIAFEGRLNGEVMQRSNTSDWIFTVQRAISFLSSGTTLEPGTVIQMGTPNGVGWFNEPKTLLQDGDTFTVFHEGGIGSLINTFVFEPYSEM